MSAVFQNYLQRLEGNEIPSFEPAYYRNFYERINTQVSTYAAENRKAIAESILGGFEHVIYTDGSKSSVGVGFSAFYNESYSTSAKLPDEFSVFRSENFAIYAAIKMAISLNTENKAFLIASDSLNSVNAIINPVDEFTKEINNEFKKIPWLYMMWIPAHLNIRGNEMADTLAKESAKRQKVEVSSLEDLR